MDGAERAHSIFHTTQAWLSRLSSLHSPKPTVPLPFPRARMALPTRRADARVAAGLCGRHALVPRLELGASALAGRKGLDPGKVSRALPAGLMRRTCAV